jgi:hypothetical protein
MPPPGVLFVLILMGLVVVAGMGMIVIKSLNWQEEQRQNRPIRVNHSADRYAPIAAVEKVRTPDPAPAHARTSADDEKERAPDSTAVCAKCAGARAREGAAIVAFRTHRDEQAARRMVRHKMQNPKADMLDTIRAGYPEIKSRSGDPKSKYQQYGKPMYDALFTEPEPEYPALEAQRRPSVVEA